MLRIAGSIAPHQKCLLIVLSIDFSPHENQVGTAELGYGTETMTDWLKVGRVRRRRRAGVRGLLLPA